MNAQVNNANLADLTDSVVALLAELVWLGTTVRHFESSANFSGQGYPEMRVGSRQFILRPDGSVLISPIADTGWNRFSGPLIVARPSTPLIEPNPANYLRLSKAGWQWAEVNLANATLCKSFDATVSAATGTNGTASIELTASVASKKGASSFRFDLQPMVSGLSCYPVEFDASKFRPDFVFELSLDDFVRWGRTVRARGPKRAVPARLALDDEAANLFIDDVGLEITLTKRPDVGSVEFPVNELRSVVKCMDSLELVGAVVLFEIDSASAMRVKFATELAAYEVCLPTIMPASRKPSKRGFRPITVS